MNDCDRKVAVNKRRLEETQDSETLGPEAQAVHELNEQIGIKLAEAEELGEKILKHFLKLAVLISFFMVSYLHLCSEWLLL